MLKDPLLFVLAVLATYRLAILFAWEDGPARVFLKIRMRLGAYNYGPDGNADTSLGELAGCPYCQGVYVALALALIFYPIGWHILLYWFAIAGGQAFLIRITEDR
jgi:hypothetical protein